jgi:sulfatase maturation enzyme AslB (radical SAM superfamily)
LFEHSQDVELIYVNGGEPTLVEKHWRYLEELINRGLNKQITLWYNINMTNLPDKLIDLWKEFKKVQITASIDDLGNRNDYIRLGSNWDTIIKNLDKLQSYSWIETSICQTISWMNVYYVNEFNKFMQARGLHVHMNYVYDPVFLSVGVLPKFYKDIILSRSTDLNEWQRNSLSNQFKGNEELFQQGLKYNEWLDSNNQTSFKDTFPEWSSLIYERTIAQ